jgi:hypothetical protein
MSGANEVDGKNLFCRINGVDKAVRIDKESQPLF